MSASKNKPMLAWRRLVPEADADAWLERLTWIGPERLIILSAPGRKTAKIEACYLTKAEAARLLREHKGSVRTVHPKEWMSSQERRFELRVPGKLRIVSESAMANEGAEPAILVPAGMAFGTGEHATTAMCVRQLARIAPKSGPRMLDAGTGSGILALAGALLGKKVLAIDNDPDCIKECRANVHRNEAVPPVQWKHLPVEKLPVSQKFDLIVANLYAEVLIGAMPRFRRLMGKGSWLIVSGILKEKAPKVRAALEREGISVEKKLRRGKWVCLVAKLKW
jgi:ribosomal protein L11 methyltransferase